MRSPAETTGEWGIGGVTIDAASTRRVAFGGVLIGGTQIAESSSNSLSNHLSNKIGIESGRPSSRSSGSPRFW